MAQCQFCDHRNARGRTRCEKCGAELPVDRVEPRHGAVRQSLSGLDAEIADLIVKHGKIAAIKRYREATGLGLKESKDAVEQLAASAGLASRGGQGCGSVILLAATVSLSGALLTAAWLRG
jgi:hypothetical protein